MEKQERTRLMVLAASWRTQAESVVQRWKDDPRGYEALTEEEKRKYLYDQGYFTAMRTLSNQLRILVENLTDDVEGGK